MNNFPKMENIVDFKVRLEESYKMKKLQDYTEKQLGDIFGKISNQISNIYGDQKEAFYKLTVGKDRSSFILEVGGKKIGILAFKNKLQKEDTCIKNKNGYIEMKSFYLFDENGHGHIWKLWKEFLNIIQKSFDNPDGLYVTISKEQASSSLNMFSKLGFNELYSVYDEYKNKSTEAYLYIDFIDNQAKNKFNISLKDKYLKYIKSGEKTTEGRSGKSFLKYKIGDSITFYNSNAEITKVLKDVVRYDNLKDFLLLEGIENCLPGISNLDQAIKIYESLPGYLEKIKKYGIVAFRF